MGSVARGTTSESSREGLRGYRLYHLPHRIQKKFSAGTPHYSQEIPSDTSTYPRNWAMTSVRQLCRLGR